MLFLLGAAALPATSARAQSPELARIDSLLDRSRFTEARTALQQWSLRSAGSQGPDDVACGLMLQARLAPRADSALQLYLELALGHPSSRLAPEALLRLGQGQAALGRHQLAASYLERALRDYPGYAGRHLAAAWLARAQRAAGQSAAACATSTSALARAGTDSAARRLLETEQRNCTLPTAAPSNPEGHYTVQVAAFRDRDAALGLMRRLQGHDIPARLVITSGSTLIRVRAGRFSTAAAADPMLRRVRALVPGAILAADAHREAGASR